MRGVDLKHPEYATTDADEFQIRDLRRWGSCLEATPERRRRVRAGGGHGRHGFISSHHAEILHNNLLISTHTLEAARQNGVEPLSVHVVGLRLPRVPPDRAQTSSRSRKRTPIPAQPQDAYGWEKLITERLCLHYGEDYGMDTRIVRFHNIFGPLGTWDGGREKAPAALCRKVATAKLTGTHEIEIWGDGEQTRSFCYIDDCVEGLYAADGVGLPRAAQPRTGPADQHQRAGRSRGGRSRNHREETSRAGSAGRARPQLGQPRGCARSSAGSRRSRSKTGHRAHVRWIEAQVARLARIRRGESCRVTRSSTRLPRVDVLGVDVSAINMEQALDVIDDWITAGVRQYVCVTGVHGVMESQRDRALRRHPQRAGLVTPDGMPLVWWSKWSGWRHTEPRLRPRPDAGLLRAIDRRRLSAFLLRRD